MKRKKEGWRCDCGKLYETRKSLTSHHSECLLFKGLGRARKKQREINLKKCPFCSFQAKLKEGQTFHEKHCQKNPERVPLKTFGSKRSIEIKRKLSESLKKAYAEGRHNNDGFKQKRNGNRSWPERWFEKVIQNEFDDKNVEYELGCGRYWIDFAWCDKQKAIEIDGDQHLRWDRSESDRRKDEFLKSKGWQILRIKWKEAYADPKKWINIAKNFIGS